MPVIFQGSGAAIRQLRDLIPVECRKRNRMERVYSIILGLWNRVLKQRGQRDGNHCGRATIAVLSVTSPRVPTPRRQR